MTTLATQSDQDEVRDQECLLFILGDQEYGINILCVQEIRGYDTQNITQIANVSPVIKGIINLRGVIVPIIDLRMKFNLAKVEYTEQTVVVILNIQSRVIGVVVDGVSDVLILKASQIRATPELGSAISTEYLTGIGTIDERMLILVDIEKLLDSEDIGLIESVEV
ncbi:chemotaxis protein CheW [Alcaligenaceae bacterium CGII-47]|nr:chemotaxis protein CheW [Alcaligenaceae bacterium CGII-47]